MSKVILDSGSPCFVAFAADKNLDNGYTGPGIIVKYDDNIMLWGEPHYEVKMPNNVFTAYFPAKCVFKKEI